MYDAALEYRELILFPTFDKRFRKSGSLGKQKQVIWHDRNV
jgi:hypothetical protein